MRLPTEAKAILTGHAFTQNSIITLRDQFPLGGEIWHTLRLIFHITATHTTATNPIVLGVFNMIRQILLRTSKNETILQAPGLGMYDLNYILDGVEPTYDVNGGTTATEYDCIIDLPFSHPLLARKEDLCIDSGRYSSIECFITIGGPEHFFGAGCEGDAVIAGTLDATLIRNKSGFEGSGKPVAVPFIKHLPSYALTRGYTDIESAKDLTLFGFIVNCQDMAASACFDPIVGTPYSGVPADNIADLTFRDNVIAYIDTVLMDFFRKERATYGTIDLADIAQFTGRYPWIFIREGSIYNAYYTGLKSEIRLENNVAALGTPTTPQLDAMLFGMRQERE